MRRRHAEQPICRRRLRRRAAAERLWVHQDDRRAVHQQRIPVRQRERPLVPVHALHQAADGRWVPDGRAWQRARADARGRAAAGRSGHPGQLDAAAALPLRRVRLAQLRQGARPCRAARRLRHHLHQRALLEGARKRPTLQLICACAARGPDAAMRDATRRDTTPRALSQSARRAHRPWRPAVPLARAAQLKNSWGRSWGDDGYFYLKRGVNQCGITSMPSYPVNCSTVNGGDPRGKPTPEPPSQADCPAPVDGDIKLTSYPAGNLLINFEGSWHPLCSQHLEIETAELMCRALGYSTAWSFSDRTVPTKGAPRARARSRARARAPLVRTPWLTRATPSPRLCLRSVGPMFPSLRCNKTAMSLPSVGGMNVFDMCHFKGAHTSDWCVPRAAEPRALLPPPASRPRSSHRVPRRAAHPCAPPQVVRAFRAGDGGVSGVPRHDASTRGAHVRHGRLAQAATQSDAGVDGRLLAAARAGRAGGWGVGHGGRARQAGARGARRRRRRRWSAGDRRRRLRRPGLAAHP